MKFWKKISGWYFSKDALPYWGILVLDCLICFLSGLLTFWVFFRGAQTLGNIVVVSRTLLLYMVFNLIAFRQFHTYAGIIRFSSFVDLQRVAFAMLSSFFMVLVVHYVIIFYDSHYYFVHLLTRHLLTMYFISTLVMWAVRILAKMLYDVSFSNGGAKRTLVYGMRDGAVAIAKDIRSQRPLKFLLQGFITKDSAATKHRLMGEKIYAEDELAEIIKNLRIDTVLVSPLMNEEFRENTVVQDILISSGVKIMMATSIQEWEKDDHFNTSQLNEVSIEDLLPRQQINVDMEKIGSLLVGKKILITGAAGSIGSEMVKLIAEHHPAELMLIDLAETPLHDIRLGMMKHVELKTRTVVSNISNKNKMEHIFHDFKPDYVFHAAAYKHVPMMEDNPSESVQNNILGTKVVADLSVKYGVKKFVMISTDKAVNPTNVMGCSKRICEIYVQSLDKAIKNGQINGITEFVTTRFGNVLGSNGSVIPLFKEQIKRGGPVTVTHPDIIRFFMLIPEACKLVLEAGTHGAGGEIYVFDMGKQVKIADLARKMIKMSGAENVEIVFTGLRDGEKLYEEVLSNEENTKPSFHEKIRIAEVRLQDYSEVCRQIDELIAISEGNDDMEIVRKMKDIVPEYKSRHSKYEILDN